MTKTEIVNMALNRIGSKRVNDYDTDNQPQAITARLQYDQTVKALLESFDWPFARARVVLSEDTDTPAFEWSHQYHLPNDFLKARESYETNDFAPVKRRWEIEGDKWLTDDDTVELKYIRNIESVNEYDPLFTEVLVLRLALKFLAPVAGTNMNTFRNLLMEELDMLYSKVRANIRQANNVSGRHDWNNARFTGGTNFASTNYRP